MAVIDSLKCVNKHLANNEQRLINYHIKHQTKHNGTVTSSEA